jgi:hypothetical protein
MLFANRWRLIVGFLFPLLGLFACSPGSGPAHEAPPHPVLASPFQGEFRVSNVSDHEYPFQFKDNNGYLLSWWGEKKIPGANTPLAFPACGCGRRERLPRSFLR